MRQKLKIKHHNPSLYLSKYDDILNNLFSFHSDPESGSNPNPAIKTNRKSDGS